MAEQLLLRIEDAAAALGISRALIYRDLIAKQAIRTVRIGGRTLIPRAELERYVERLCAEQLAER